MPTLLDVKEVRSVNSKEVSYSCAESDQVSFAELRGAFDEYNVKFLSKNKVRFWPGEKPPKSAVIIEVKEEDGTDGRFSKPGLYMFIGLSPEQAHQLLGEYRGELPRKGERARGESLSHVKARVLEKRRLPKSPKGEERT